MALDLREKLAHIDQMLADHDRKRQEIRYAPWVLAAVWRDRRRGVVRGRCSLHESVRVT